MPPKHFLSEWEFHLYALHNIRTIKTGVILSWSQSKTWYNIYNCNYARQVRWYGNFQPCSCTWGSRQAAEEINNTLEYKYGCKNLPLVLQTKCEAITAMCKCYLNQVQNQHTFYIILKFASLLVPSGTHRLWDCQQVGNDLFFWELHDLPTAALLQLWTCLCL